MFQKFAICVIFLSFLINLSIVHAENKVEHKIAVLVNENVITSYDIIQRLKLTAIIQGINLNSQNNQLMINNTVDELIHEKVKLEKIEEFKMKVEEDEYLEFESNFFKRNNIDKSRIILLLEENNVSYRELKNLLTKELLWGKLISGLYLRLTSVSDIEINDIISKNPNVSVEQAQNLVKQRQLDLHSSKLLRDIMNEATIEYR